MVQIGPLITEMQDVGENVCSILYYIHLFEEHEQYKKKRSSAKQFYFSILSLDTNCCLN